MIKINGGSLDLVVSSELAREPESALLQNFNITAMGFNCKMACAPRFQFAPYHARDWVEANELVRKPETTLLQNITLTLQTFVKWTLHNITIVKWTVHAFFNAFHTM
ncbi:hypothetical protein CDAR_320111 [Caerostris darwini]|uniref:Uncharacterized protein n=1 Tax=Caerostris darwini TaxID=1538125 RepID=A0AAV4WY95_9ARAC|nr:hypothetical protein CDAR_320111 [Caerostris darwini]